MENEIIQLIARDRLEIPLSSMYQKIKKVKKKDAEGLAAKLKDDFENSYDGERTFAYVASEDISKARGVKEAMVEFAKEFPKYASILAGKIAEKRAISEEHLYFGVNAPSRLSSDDYVGVIQSLGFSETTARNLYPELLKVSRKLASEREEDRSVIVGKYEVEE